MTDGERLRQFRADFEKLKHNRDQVPLDILKTKYAAGYEAQVKKVLEGGDWYADAYLQHLPFPLHPQDEAGNEWLAKRIAAIERKENAPGGLREQWRAALIDDLDMDKFGDLVYRRYERRLQEAFDPYWQRHNKWVGEPGKRWIYNDIFKKFWWPKTEGYPASGCWINSDYTGHDSRFPPNIKEDAQ